MRQVDPQIAPPELTRLPSRQPKTSKRIWIAVTTLSLIFLATPLVQLWPYLYFSEGRCLTGEDVQFKQVFAARDPGREGHFMRVCRLNPADCHLLRQRQLEQSAYPMWSPGAAMDGQRQASWQRIDSLNSGIFRSFNRALRLEATEVAPESIRSMDDVRRLAAFLIKQPNTIAAGHYDDHGANFSLKLLDLERGILIQITLVT